MVPMILQGVDTWIMYSYIPLGKLEKHSRATNIETDSFAPRDANSSIDMTKAPKAYFISIKSNTLKQLLS